MIRKIKSLYYAKLFLENAGNSRKIWEILNYVLNRKNKTMLEELKVNGVKLREKELVDYINEFFINAALNIRVAIPGSLDFHCLAPREISSCFLRPANILEIIGLIRKLKNKGNVIFDINPLLLKDNIYIYIFSEHILILYNLSIEICIFPNPLKIARVTPVFKSRELDNVDNYRPISSLPVLLKLFERLTLNRMLSFVYAKNILSTSQFGFRKG